MKEEKKAVNIGFSEFHEIQSAMIRVRTLLN